MEIVPTPCRSILHKSRPSQLPYSAKSDFSYNFWYLLPISPVSPFQRVCGRGGGQGGWLGRQGGQVTGVQISQICIGDLAQGPIGPLKGPIGKIGRKYQNPSKNRILHYMGVERVWRCAKYSYRVWERFPHQANPFLGNHFSSIFEDPPTPHPPAMDWRCE